MIKQKVRLIKKTSDDGFFHFKDAELNIEFWVYPATIRMASYRRADSGHMFNELVVRAENGQLIPASMLEYTSEFEVEDSGK